MLDLANENLSRKKGELGLETRGHFFAQ